MPVRLPVYLTCLLLIPGCYGLMAQPKPMSERMAETVMTLHRDSIVTKEGNPARWDYEQGLVLKALERVWQRTGDGRYYAYILRDMNRFISADGRIRTFRMDEYNLDNITPGRTLLTLAQQTEAGREKFRRAADTLRAQLTRQPRTQARGFWHKQRYPNQMWLDGLYMAEPFYAEYSALYRQPENFDDIALQFALIEKNLLDPKTGLLYHGYDESRQQKWANPKTGVSPNFWGRSIGWYAMALVDVLDYFPSNHPRRADLVGYLQRLMPIVVRYQDKATGCWYQIPDQASRKGNYPEASASCMFVYALAKGVRMGYLPATLLDNARRGYAGILKTFVETGTNGLPHLNGTVSVGGLGGNPYRDGSYEYYLSEPIKKNDLKGVGPFIMASVEMEIADEPAVGRGRNVGLDYYFNHEFRKSDAGPGAPEREPFHYTWEDRMHSGFWLWGNTFRELGAKTVAVPVVPTAQSLKNVDVYIIVDPDTPKETAAPRYIQPTDSKAVEDWVRAGGVLVLMANDTANCEIPHFNELASRFGVRFGSELVNPVQGTQWEGGKLTIPAGGPIFSTTRTIYIKELSPLTLTRPAQSALTDAKGRVIMATAKVGKGTVFVVGDPWLYNEYTDGRRIPNEYQNFRAGKELATWLLKQCPSRK
ncbi:glycoside hydrolase family 88 protein [Spirosoma sp. 209]|uniref:glycoside hydrolase family 88 protein n=1 Tax=Spirosoma sp. 209 TaxID=1955701 RepID=UPI0035188716